MTKFFFNFRTGENYPSSNECVGIKLQSCLAESHKRMGEQRDRINKKYDRKNYRLCNRCNKLFKKEDTINARYKGDSDRKHRLCKECYKIIGGVENGKEGQ